MVKNKVTNPIISPNTNCKKKIFLKEIKNLSIFYNSDKKRMKMSYNSLSEFQKKILGLKYKITINNKQIV